MEISRANQDVKRMSIDAFQQSEVSLIAKTAG